MKRCRRRPTLPRSLDRSTIGAIGLNDRVRDGNECGPYALVASESLTAYMYAVRQTECGSEKEKRIKIDRVALLAVNYMGVVKPHGRLGPLRSEGFAPRPRAAYRRDGLSRPFRELEAPGEFILGGASHLDAFSGYPRLPSLPGVAPGGTAGTRAGSPTRSSRTRVRAPQLSNAHDGYRPNCLTTF